ncbi:MAG: sugar phosphate isomerase/epimerase [Clostridia bacterium]|nr:sugar phosphate isomerase/epimerase [Clostridia bacterium]
MNKPMLIAFADEAGARLDEQIAALLRNGMDGIELRNVDGENVSDIGMDKAREIRRRLDDAGLITWSIGSPIGKIDLVGGDFTAHLDKLRHTVDIARALGAGNIRMFSFYLPAGEDPAKYRDAVMERLRRMVQACEGSGVTLCHENEKGIYGDVASRCLDIHQSVPALAGIFDPANFIQCGQDTAEAWGMLKPHIKYMHIKDALADGTVVPAGRGIGNVKAIVKDYTENGGVALTLEPHLRVFSGMEALERRGQSRPMEPYAYESGDAAFDAAAAALRELLV